MRANTDDIGARYLIRLCHIALLLQAVRRRHGSVPATMSTSSKASRTSALVHSSSWSPA